VGRSRPAVDFMVTSDRETVFGNTLPIRICDSLSFVTHLHTFFSRALVFEHELVFQTSVSTEVSFREGLSAPSGTGYQGRVLVAGVSATAAASAAIFSSSSFHSIPTPV